MSMSALVRALGAAAGGFSTGMREAEDAADRKRRRDQEAEDRAFTMAERARATKLRDDMGAASAPVDVVQRDQAGPVDPGSDIPAARQPLETVSTVQGKSYESPQAATMAAAAANAPQAVAQRQAQVLSQAGNPLGAQQLRTGAMQEQSAKYTLNAAERADIDARFNADLQAKVTDWDSLGRFMSESPADGNGGATKFAVPLSPDGKARVVNKIGPDGQLIPTGHSFPNTGLGLQQAMVAMMKLSPEAKITHIHHQETLAQKSEYDAALLQVAQDKNATNMEIAALRLAAAKAHGAGGAQTAATGIDMGAADKFINELFTTKDATTQETTFDPKGASTVRSLIPRMPAAQAGDTQGAVNQALMAYNRYLKMAGGDHDRAVQMMEPAMAPPAPAKPAAAKPQAPAVTPSAPAAMTMQAKAKAPSYEGWMAAKKQRDTLIQQAQAMSPDRRESWLQSRLPAAEQAIAYHDNYLKN